MAIARQMPPVGSNHSGRTPTPLYAAHAAAADLHACRHDIILEPALPKASSSQHDQLPCNIINRRALGAGGAQYVRGTLVRVRCATAAASPSRLLHHERQGPAAVVGSG
jgi:hypothetical protein